MLGSSFNLFRIAGIQLAVHWSFLALLAWAAWEGSRGIGWVGAAWTVGYVLLLFGCIILHELGHCFAARRFGVWINRILLLPIGGMAEFEWLPRRPWQEVIIAIAGPAVNVLIVAFLLLAGVRFPPDWAMATLPMSLADLGRHLVVLNVVMGAFNLIPVFPMDGGRILRALLALKLSYLRATWVAATLAKVLALLAIVGLVFGLEEPHWLGVALFLFIVAAGELEYRVVRQRQEDEERWHRLLARFYATPPQVVECEPTRGPLP